MKYECIFCGEGFDHTPFTIVTHESRFEDVCGTCMNLWANDEFGELTERALKFRSSGIKLE